jgi:transcriptional regulator of acetoin/glycerol metabolism
MDRTVDQPRTRPRLNAVGPPIPGLLLVFTGRQPTLGAIALEDGSIELGRGQVGGIPLNDGAISRRHARVSFRAAGWRIEDLGSRNGTFVDGAPVQPEVEGDALKVLHIGSSLFLLSADVRRFWSGFVDVPEGTVIGPTLREVFQAIERAARFGSALHVTGESGAGKELAARAFHDYGPRASGPFIAVNCAAIPEGLAERLLFGARKGAYSGATADVEGYVQAADGGTLFLDEVAELDQAVQAKLLRVLETREVLPLGASRPRTVDIRICSATHKGLRAQVASGEFREDLYFRIGRPEVVVPPLRERLEEIPWLIDRELRRVQEGLTARPSLVETCLLRRWPGNVRELLTEVRDAARTALSAGADSVEALHLCASAGQGFAPEEDADPAAAGVSGRDPPTREAIEAALRREEGNVARTARALGMHRTQLRRWLARNNVDPRRYSSDPNRMAEDDPLE